MLEMINRTSVLGVLGAVVVSVVACGHEIDSPGLSAAPPVVPDLVCVEQLTTNVSLAGDGFVPMPINTLAGDVRLVLPKVVLAQKLSLDGAPASASFTIPDDAANPAASKLHWLSPQKMTFDVFPELALAPGLYDIDVTNPDGSKSTTFAGALAAVPRPGATKVTPDLFCDAEEDQTITITGTNVLKIGTQLAVARIGTKDFTASALTDCKDVPGTHVEGSVQLCSTASFVIPKGSLEAGNYDVTITNPGPAACKSTEKLSVAVVPAPTVATIVPTAICDDETSQTITINGTGFLEVGTTLPTLTIGGKPFVPTSAGGCMPVAGTFIEGAVQECTSLMITVPKGTFTSGDYPVEITNPPPAACKTLQMVSLRDEAPPTVATVAPATICSGGSKLTLDGTGFLGTPTVTLEASGQATITGTNTTVNGAGTQLQTQLGAGANAGTTYDVVVTNPDGCFDTPPPHKTVTVVPGPVLFLADPEVVYNGVNTGVTIYGTGFNRPFPAGALTIVPNGAAAPVTTLAYVDDAPAHPNRLDATVPKDQPAGVYDLYFADNSGCTAFLPKAITVKAATTITIKNVVPPFGTTASDTAITIFRDTAAAAPGNQVFIAPPRVFLNPTGVATANTIPLESVSFVNGDTLTAVVPKGTPPHVYDLLVTNPDGTVGFLGSAYTETTAALPPPTITTVTPSSVVNTTGQVVTVVGQAFRASTITATCKTAAGVSSVLPVTSGAVTCGGNGCTQTATLNASSLTAADNNVCILRLTNADGTYADYSAIGVTGSSLNLQKPPKAGSNMNTARRALVASAANATSAARFVYAIGGDASAATANAPFNTSEFASVDIFGTMGPWQAQRYDLGGARSFAGVGKQGRYTYIFGGSDGAANLATARRAITLDPQEVPGLDINDLVLQAAGLDAGYWFYRVSATFGAGDLDNPGGESLPSREVIVRVPTFAGKKVAVVLSWTAAVDALGAALPNVSGYRVYRTKAANGAAGTEVLLGTTGAAVLSFSDDGTAVPGTEAPLPTGSMGKWASLATMTTARKGPAGAVAFDPGNANRFYVYAGLGLDAANAALGSYEFLRVDIAANGHQTAAGAWTLGSGGAAAIPTPRWQAGAFSADSTVSTTIAVPDTYVFFGGGITALGAAANAVHVGKVAAGGDLGAIAASKPFSSNVAGYGVLAANNQLFTFGGANAAPSNGAKSSSFLGAAPGLANWNSEGLSLLQPRYLMGSAVQSAFLFLVGGDTAAGVGSNTTELVVW
jgi:hypothetical protein